MPNRSTATAAVRLSVKVDLYLLLSGQNQNAKLVLRNHRTARTPQIPKNEIVQKIAKTWGKYVF
eukprot:6325605-Amphidinium_carterae.1